MAAAKLSCALFALVGTAAALTLLAPRPPEGPPSPERVAELVHGPITEADVRGWAARSDWSLPPELGERIEWQGGVWVVAEVRGGELLVTRRDEYGEAHLIPCTEARLVPSAHTLPTGEVVHYRPHGVPEP